MPRILLTAAVAVAVAVAVPSVAHGATLHEDGRSPHRILLQDERGETNLVSVEGTRSVVIHDLNAPITVAGVPTCMPLDANTVSCAAVRRVELDLGDGPDNARVATPLPVSIDGGPGNDRYVAYATDWPARVDFAGGIGLDVANYGFATAGVRYGFLSLMLSTASLKRLWHRCDRSLKCFGEAHEDAFGAADVGEPIRILVLHHFAHELRAVGK